MKNFIEVVDEEIDDKILVNVNNIREILKTSDGKSFIVLGVDAAGGLVGFYTKETYIEIKHKLIEL